jgi:hypothetical protein
MQTVSWQLYYDRTFELLYGGDATSPNDPGVIGVQADAYQFMQFTGVLAQLSNQQAASIQGTGTDAVQNAATVAANALNSSAAGSTDATPVTTGGIMMMMPCYVYFGNASQQWANTRTTAANNAAIARQLAYYGYISEWSVQYTHWTVNMVPIRCVISVNFTMLPNPVAGTAQSTWNDIQKLNGSYVASVPYAQNVTPPSSLFNR